MEVSFEGGEAVSFFNNQKERFSHVMKDKLERVLTRMLEYDLKEAL